MTFNYKNHIKFNREFDKSTNILYDKEDCNKYILTTSAINTLNILFSKQNANSISVIGPFGCGKSSLLLYIDTLLSNSNNSKKCAKKLSDENEQLYKQFSNYKKGRKFFKLKIVGEYMSFKSQFKNAILELKELKKTIGLLKNNEYQVSKVLSTMSDEIKELGYSDVIFSIDEFGKFIEYSLEDNNPSDMFELQTISEFVNRRKNWKLITSLHKTFKEYASSNHTLITYSEWDKIQGRFEHVVFRDDYFEMLNVFKEAIILDEKSECIKGVRKHIKKICQEKGFEKQIGNKKILDLFSDICPIHPYTALIIAELFTKYFQNQRSIYSFLFSNEPNSFREFIGKEFKNYTLYTLSNLYDYIKYLLKIYNILLPDEELWRLSEQKLKDGHVENEIQKDIIKTIALLHTFKINYTVVPSEKHLALSLEGIYTEKEIKANIDALKKSNIIIFQEQSQSYSLLEDSNIDINKEMKNILSQNANFNYEKEINDLLIYKKIFVKRFFLTYGLKKQFEKIYILEDKEKTKEPYKIFFIAKEQKKQFNEIMKSNDKSIFVFTKNHNKLKTLSKEIISLKYIEKENKEKLSLETKKNISDMIFDRTISFENVLKADIEESIMCVGTEKYVYSPKVLQNLMSGILEKCFTHTPIINNYTLNHTENKNTSIVKLLFNAMLENPYKEYLGFTKMPAEKALYLSVIKPTGIHIKSKDCYILSEPSRDDFKPIWNAIKTFLHKKVALDNLIEYLSKEPFGLDRSKALFVISLFIIVNKESVSIFQDNTYKYNTHIDLIINMWKASKKYELQFVILNDDELKLFKAYMKATSDITDFTYSKTKITVMTKIIYTKINSMPKFSKTTQQISKKAKSLRSILISAKEPIETFFNEIPKALGYKSIQNIDEDKYMMEFKTTFNEIALSYKHTLVELEKYIANKFMLSTSLFPYNNELTSYANKISSVSGLEKNINSILRSFIYSDSLQELLNSLSITLVKKEIEECTDRDLEEFKNMIDKYSKRILEKLELIDIAKNKKNVRKVSLDSFAEEFNKIIAIDDKKIGIITKEAENMRKLIPSSYTADEKIYLISQILKEEFENE